MNISEQSERASAPGGRGRVGTALFATIPIVLVGSMAVGLGLTGPIEPVAQKRPDRPKTSPGELLAKSIRTAFAASGRASQSTGTSTPMAVSSVAAAPTTYTVAAGDTVSSIAGRYGLATASVLALNGLGWKSVIFPGQVLKLTNSGPAPVAVAPAAPVSKGVTRYTIAKGDTMGKVAARFGITTQTLLSANGLGWSSIIYPGQSVVIPSTVAPASTSSAPILAATPTVSVAPSSMTLTAEMTTNAKTIIRVGRSLKVPDYGIVVALAAALQESGLRNLDYGDRDSLGLFQQRPSMGWGTPAQLQDPSFASRLFFGGAGNPNNINTRGLLDIAGWQSKSVTQAAQAVQRSAYPNAYAKWEITARATLAHLG
jgi:LysM repeat protein